MSTKAFWPMIAVALLVGCNGGGPLSVPNPKADIDAEIEDDLADSQQRPAIECLLAGAKHYEDSQNPSNTVDKDVLLPLCQRLESEFRLKPIAVLEQDDNGKDHIFEIVAKLPADAVARAGIQAAIRDADAPFPGKIETSWGDKWLSFTLEPPIDLE